MAYVIAHRGNLNGPVAALENAPDYVDKALEAGFVAEVDLRKVGNDFFLGHDFPLYQISRQWLNDREGRILIHVKDYETLKDVSASWHTFAHSRDPFTITSRKLIWLHDLSVEPDSRTIVPLITKELLKSYRYDIPGAICTDFCTSVFVDKNHKLFPVEQL